MDWVVRHRKIDIMKKEIRKYAGQTLSEVGETGAWFDVDVVETTNEDGLTRVHITEMEHSASGAGRKLDVYGVMDSNYEEGDEYYYKEYRPGNHLNIATIYPKDGEDIWECDVLDYYGGVTEATIKFDEAIPAFTYEEVYGDGPSYTQKGKVKKDGDYDTADEVSSAILEIPGVEGIAYAPYNGYGGDDVDIMVSLEEGTDIQTVIDAINYDDVVDLEDNGDRTYTFTVITGYKFDKSEVKKRGADVTFESIMPYFEEHPRTNVDDLTVWIEGLKGESIDPASLDDILRNNEAFEYNGYNIRLRKSKTEKADISYSLFDREGKHSKRIVELAEQYCPHATRIFAGHATDIIWDLPSGNHPGFFLDMSKDDDGDEHFYGSITASTYLDYPENTPDGEMPAEMEDMATEMYNKSNAEGISESELIEYMKRMDAMCTELQSFAKSKTKKSTMWGGYSEEDGAFIYEVRTNGEKVYDERFENVSADEPYRQTEYVYNGEKYRIFDYRFYPPNMELVKSKTSKGEKKIPISEDDTVEIEEMDGKRYVEIEPKEEHAEEVATGYEQEGDDLNTEDNITHPDTSKPKKSKTKKAGLPKKFTIQVGGKDCTFEKQSDSSTYYVCNEGAIFPDGADAIIEDVSVDGGYVNAYFSLLQNDGSETNRAMSTYEDFDTVVEHFEMWCNDRIGKSKTQKSAPPMMSVNDAIRTCAEYQWANKRNGLMPDEIYQLTGNRPENFMSGMVARGRVAKMKCADGIMYRFKM